MSNPRNRWKIVRQDQSFGSGSYLSPSEFMSIAYGNGHWVAVGRTYTISTNYGYVQQAAGIIAHSTDGQNWISGNGLGPYYDFVDVTFHNNKFIIIGNKYVYSYGEYIPDSIVIFVISDFTFASFEQIIILPSELLDLGGFQTAYNSKIVYNDGWIIFNGWYNLLLVPETSDDLSSTWRLVDRPFNWINSTCNFNVINNLNIISYLETSFDAFSIESLKIFSSSNVHVTNVNWQARSTIPSSYINTSGYDNLNLFTSFDLEVDDQQYFIPILGHMLHSSSLDGPWYKDNIPYNFGNYYFNFQVKYADNKYVMNTYEYNLGNALIAVSPLLGSSYQPVDFEAKYDFNYGKLYYSNGNWFLLGSQYKNNSFFNQSEYLSTIWTPEEVSTSNKAGWDIVM